MVPKSSKGYLAPNAYGLQNHVTVIPCGGLLGDMPTYWNKNQLAPYAHYIVNGKQTDTLFNGFVFNGIRVRDTHFIHPLFVGFGEPSDITDWIMWADGLFLPNLNLQALAAVAGKSKRDVWVSIPYPHPMQNKFGVVGSRMLDFQKEEDRLAAVVWWMDLFLQRWRNNRHLHSQLQLRGFLWQREAADANDIPLIGKVNQHIHQLGYRAMWLPNYGSYGVTEWRDLGFDVTAINTNYTGNTSYDYKWIQNAALFAATYHNGLQILWGKGLIYSNRHQLDYWNLGLPRYCDYMQKSFLVYSFPNQRLDQIYRTQSSDYIKLYTFVKGLYQKTAYPKIPY